MKIKTLAILLLICTFIYTSYDCGNKEENMSGVDSTKSKIEGVSKLTDSTARKTVEKTWGNNLTIVQWQGLFWKSEYEIRASAIINTGFYDFLSGKYKSSDAYGNFIFCKDLNENWVYVKSEFNPTYKGIQPLDNYHYSIVEEN